jgi:cell fate regulator YaaT (PSP1 superfamily)
LNKSNGFEKGSGIHMSDSDEYEDIDEDIAALEDNPAEENLEGAGVIAGQGTNFESITSDTPIYRLRLFYSHETFLAVYKGDPPDPGSMVLVPTRYGRDLAQVIGRVSGNSVPSVSEFTWIERPASKEDLEKSTYNRELEKDAFRVCREKIESHRLEMKLVSVHYLLEEPKILFFFTAENRVDFRELVKDLVSVFKTRIELRQIGVRDEARVVGGLGVCGRGYCCHMVSDKLKPVSIKMAKDQNLSLNSMKISGPCGRLLCCLSYEHGFYSEQRRLIPPEGVKISHDNTMWKVMEVNVVLGRLKLSAEDGRQITVPASKFEKIDNRWRIHGEGLSE